MNARWDSLLADLRETLTWCEDFREGMFTPAATTDGWTVEMHGLIAGLLNDLPRAIAVLEPHAHDPRGHVIVCPECGHRTDCNHLLVRSSGGEGTNQ